MLEGDRYRYGDEAEAIWGGQEGTGAGGEVVAVEGRLNGATL